jgi:hypothetical protein
MTREELEHIIRASGNITNRYEFVILGSQSILGAIPNPPPFFTVSAEADIYPLDAPELADAIDGAIGEGSPFHEAKGFYAQGVGPETATLPEGWMARVHRIQNANTDLRVGLCLGVLDLFMSKAWAGRDKDRAFCAGLLQHAFVKLDHALAMVPRMPLEDTQQQTLTRRIKRWAASPKPPVP